MAWTSPKLFIAGNVLTAAEMNTYMSDNDTALRGGGIAIASQAANDFIYASSATQLARLAPTAGDIPIFNGSAWVMKQLYAVGDIYTSTSSTNPGTRLGYGTWTAFGAGRVMVGIDAGQTEFDTVEETGGAKTHTLTTAEIPSHTHATNVLQNSGSGAVQSLTTSAGGAEVTSEATGGGGAHNNLQPYIVVYMWKRTA